MRFNFRRLFRRPRVWSESDHRKVTWTELFFDLFYVAATTNVAHLLIASPWPSGGGQFMLYYTIFYFTWASRTLFLNRFRLEGLLFDCLGLVYYLGIMGMVLAAQQFAWYARFAASFLVVRLVSIIEQAAVNHFVPKVRLAGTLIVLHHCITAVLALLAAIFSREVFVVLFVIIAFFEALAPLIPVWIPKARLPIHVQHTAERMGLIIMIFLGESIVGFGIQPLANTANQYVGIALGTIVIWCLYLLYYHLDPEKYHHAFRQGRMRGLVFHYAHWLLGATILITGDGLRLVLNLYPGTPGHSVADAAHEQATHGGINHGRESAVPPNVGLPAPA